MHVTLAEAAAILHKSERQLRYMMQLGTLKAEKVGKRWLIPRDQLAVSATSIETEARRLDKAAEAAAQSAPAPRAAAVSQVVEDVLHAPATGPTRFSVRGLQAWRIIAEVHADLRIRLGADAPAVQALRRALRQLAHGCHRFFRDDKANAYRAARDDVSDAVFLLIVDDVPHADAAIDRLENDGLAAMAGLLRRYDQRRPG